MKVTGEPFKPAADAVREFAPAPVPSVQLPTAAIPEAFVTAVPPVIEPPPLATANVTDAPPTGLLYVSAITTLGVIATAVPTVADCELPAFGVTFAATPVPTGGCGVGTVGVESPPLPPHEVIALREVTASATTHLDRRVHSQRTRMIERRITYLTFADASGRRMSIAGNTGPRTT